MNSIIIINFDFKKKGFSRFSWKVNLKKFKRIEDETKFEGERDNLKKKTIKNTFLSKNEIVNDKIQNLKFNQIKSKYWKITKKFDIGNYYYIYFNI